MLGRQTNEQIEKRKKDFDSSIVMKMKFRIRMTYVKTHTKQKINRKGKKKSTQQRNKKQEKIRFC